MHSHKSKLSLFRSNRSQASLLSAHESRSYQASPIDSPLQSPAFPPNSAVSSLDSEDRDDTFIQRQPLRDSDTSQYYTGNGTHLPQRSQSQRTPPAQKSYTGASPTQPPLQLTGTLHGSAKTSTIHEHPDSDHQQDQVPAKAGPKRLRRFLGFGETSNHKDFVNKQSIGRSISKRRASLEPQIITTLEEHLQNTWPSGSTSATYSPTTRIGEEEEGSTLLDSPYSQYPEETPPIPPKDLPKSPRSTTLPEQERSHTLLTTAPKQTGGEHQGPFRASTWDRKPRPPNHNPNPSSEHLGQHQTIPSVSGSGYPETQDVASPNYPPSLRSGQELAYSQSQHTLGSRPSSRQSYEPSSPGPASSQFRQRQSSVQGGSGYLEGSMAPPPTQTSARSVEPNQQGSQNGTNGREGGAAAYQSYPQGTQTGSQPNNGQTSSQYGPQLSVNNQPAGSYRGTPQASPMGQQNNSEQGRSTPPPNRSRDDLSGHDVAALHAKYDELSESNAVIQMLLCSFQITDCLVDDKYRKVKKYYFDKDAQVQQLQNTLAHQRLSQSRTSLDDNEYATRFLRLNGAIDNLAFNIRKGWHTVPDWLAPHVNREATTSATKEMIAVGRACISRWLVDEIFDRFFHPSLEPTLSCQLKIIEKNLRRFAPPTPTDEEKEALAAKISNWRLSTLDGLQDMLASQKAANFRSDLTKDLVEDLIARLTPNLKEPTPEGLEAGVLGIVELAVGVAANLPLESRDVYVEYIAPGTLFNDAYMKTEGTLSPLTNPGESAAEITEKMSMDDSDEKEEDRESLKDNLAAQQQQQQQQQHQSQGKKKGMFGGLMTKKPATGTGTLAAATTGTRVGNSNGEREREREREQGPKEERIRFAAFMAVEVRGRSTLVKAPVYI